MTDRATRARRKRLGRPPGTSKTVRPHRVVTFVTGPELRQLREISETCGESLSAIVHKLVSLGLQRCTKQGTILGEQDDQIRK